MKRSLCPEHIYHLKVQGKTVQLNTKECSICRWKARPIRLPDMARELEGIAESMRFAYENPDYDPFGYTFTDIFKLMNRFLKSCHKDYRKNFINDLTKDVEV